MKVERAGFLLCVAALTACPRAADPPPAAPEAPGALEVPVATVATPAPADEGETKAPPLPACSDPEVPACVAFGLPGPTCEQGMDPGLDCVLLRGILRPDAARAAVTCMINRRGTCLIHASQSRSASDCFLASLSSACERPGARGACDPIVAKCKGRLDTEICVGELTAVTDAVRDRTVACLTKQCDPRCFESIRGASVTPPKPTAKAPRSQAESEIAKWTVGTVLPAAWSQCRLATDCAVLSRAACGSIAVNHRHAAYAHEVLRRDARKNPPLFYPRCAGSGLPSCVGGTCDATRVRAAEP